MTVWSRLALYLDTVIIESSLFMYHLLMAGYRILAIAVALLLMMLAVTGVLLNHSEELALKQRHLDWPWLLDYYGVAEVEADRVYLLDDNVISQFGDQIFVDATPMANSLKPIIGGIHLDTLTVIASDDTLLLLNEYGELIETMGAEKGIPSQIQNIGLFHGLPVLQTRNGMWRGDELLEQWQAMSLQGVSWSEPTMMPTIVAQDLARYFYGKGVSIERVALDLHNGHIIGQLGIWLLDGVAFILLLFSISGLWLWGRHR